MPPLIYISIVCSLYIIGLFVGGMTGLTMRYGRADIQELPDVITDMMHTLFVVLVACLVAQGVLWIS